MKIFKPIKKVIFEFQHHYSRGKKFYSKNEALQRLRRIFMTNKDLFKTNDAKDAKHIYKSYSFSHGYLFFNCCLNFLFKIQIFFFIFFLKFFLVFFYFFC